MVNLYATNKIQPPIPVLYQIADILNVDVRDLLVSNLIKEYSPLAKKRLRLVTAEKRTDTFRYVGGYGCGSPFQFLGLYLVLGSFQILLCNSPVCSLGFNFAIYRKQIGVSVIHEILFGGA